MTRDEARAMAALMLAYADGKTVQVRLSDDSWMTIIDAAFNSPVKDYRIKPEPKEVWVNEYPDGGLGGAFVIRESAIKAAVQGATRVAVHYREVCDE